MPHELHTEIDIDARPETVWQVLTDLDRYSEMEPVHHRRRSLRRPLDDQRRPMTPPEMRTWNLAVRLGLELAALTGLGLAAWSNTTGAARWVVPIATPLAAAAVWATFNVLDDPSRSGRAPVEVSGRVRLGVELLILGSGWIAYGIAGYPVMGAAFATVTVLHYVVARERVHWLLIKPPATIVP